MSRRNFLVFIMRSDGQIDNALAKYKKLFEKKDELGLELALITEYPSKTADRLKKEEIFFERIPKDDPKNPDFLHIFIDKIYKQKFNDWKPMAVIFDFLPKCPSYGYKFFGRAMMSNVDIEFTQNIISPEKIDKLKSIEKLEDIAL